MTEHNPTSGAELAELLATAEGARQSVRLGGNFTKDRWAGPIADADLRISTARMNRVLNYEPKDLTISVEAGMTYRKLTALLAANGQMVPLDPPYSSTATLGGILAANHSGPRRRLFGTARDLVIGMQFATLEGKLVQSGGMVVKNVAGLDMAKLMIGSWGTLAAIAVVNFKLIPRDRVTRTFLLPGESAADVLSQRNKILESVLQPAGLDVLNPQAAARVGRGGWLLAVYVGGSERVIDRYVRELSGAEVLADEEESRFFEAICEFTPRFLEEHPGGSVVRASTTLQGLGTLLASSDEPIVARAANGVAWIHYAGAPAPAVSAGSWPHASASFVTEAGPASREGDSLWPAPGNDLPLMEKTKRMLDPNRLLNKGRLYGRI